jgi:hypothetical protein
MAGVSIVLLLAVVCMCSGYAFLFASSLFRMLRCLREPVSFAGLSYTRAELRRLDWNHVAKLELEQWKEVRSPQALDTPAAREWLLAGQRRERAAEQDRKRAALQAKDAEAARAQDGKRKAEKTARLRHALVHVDEALQEETSHAPVSFGVCRSHHNRYGICVHHFTEPCAGQGGGKTCVRCTRDHEQPQSATPEPDDDRANECTVETWAARNGTASGELLMTACGCPTCGRASAVIAGQALYGYHGDRRCYVCAPPCGHRHLFGSREHAGQPVHGQLQGPRAVSAWDGPLPAPGDRRHWMP